MFLTFNFLVIIKYKALKICFLLDLQSLYILFNQIQVSTVLYCDLGGGGGWVSVFWVSLFFFPVTFCSF